MTRATASLERADQLADHAPAVAVDELGANLEPIVERRPNPSRGDVVAGRFELATDGGGDFWRYFHRDDHGFSLGHGKYRYGASPLETPDIPRSHGHTVARAPLANTPDNTKNVAEIQSERKPSSRSDQSVIYAASTFEGMSLRGHEPVGADVAIGEWKTRTEPEKRLNAPVLNNRRAAPVKAADKQTLSPGSPPKCYVSKNEGVKHGNGEVFDPSAAVVALEDPEPSKRPERDIRRVDLLGGFVTGLAFIRVGNISGSVILFQVCFFPLSAFFLLNG